MHKASRGGDNCSGVGKAIESDWWREAGAKATEAFKGQKKDAAADALVGTKIARKAPGSYGWVHGIVVERDEGDENGKNIWFEAKYYLPSGEYDEEMNETLDRAGVMRRQKNFEQGKHFDDVAARAQLERMQEDAEGEAEEAAAADDNAGEAAAAAAEDDPMLPAES